MTPKEKAEELIYIFSQIIPASSYEAYEDGVRINFDLENAKQCALITVNEIIKALRKDLPEIGLGKGYWYTVKKEIEDL